MFRRDILPLSTGQDSNLMGKAIESMEARKGNVLKENGE
jgi:hypothetical protein